MNVQTAVNPQPVIESQGPVAKDRPERRLLSQAQTAEYLGVCVRTIYALARRGKLKRVMIAGTIRYDLEDLSGLIMAGKKD